MDSKIYEEDEFRIISEIQHFSFCRRQWGLIHIEQQWSDNMLTTAGSIVHNRVHVRNLKDCKDGIITIRGLRVKSFELGITGECDAVEFVPVKDSDDGIKINGKTGLWQPIPVEYKRGRQKNTDCDRLQVVAQALCLEEMFSCSIHEAYIFYNETRRREIVDVDDDIKNKVCNMLKEMHSYAKAGYTPRVKPKTNCKNCSLYNECIPGLMTIKETPSDYIKRHIGEISNEEDA